MLTSMDSKHYMTVTVPAVFLNSAGSETYWEDFIEEAGSKERAIHAMLITDTDCGVPFDEALTIIENDYTDENTDHYTISGPFESPEDYTFDYFSEVTDLETNPLAGFVDWTKAAREISSDNLTFVLVEPDHEFYAVTND